MEILKSLIFEGQEKVSNRTVNRRYISLPEETDRIITITGARRTGKTYLEFHEMQSVLKKVDNDATRIVYIDFEDDRLYPLTLEKLGEIPNVYYEMFPSNKNKRVWFFFDEIQTVKKWELFIRRLNETENCRIILTGSSSTMLSKEIATQLRGRTMNVEVFPYSLSELISITHGDVNRYLSKDLAKIKQQRNRYLEEGGFPETLGLSIRNKHQLWREYIDLILYKDIIERHNVGNTHMLKYYFKFLNSNIANQLSIQKVFRDMKSQGLKVGKNSLYDYLEYFEDAYALFTVPMFTDNLREQHRNPRKIYNVDIGLKNAMTISKDSGRALENAVFLELRRNNRDIYYWKGKQEVDFCVSDYKGVRLYNVSETISDHDTRSREIGGLIEGMNELDLDEAIIITLNEKETIEQDSKTIHVLPFHEFALMNMTDE